MPNDAKLGMVVGVGLVIAVAVIFFRKDLTGQANLNGPPAATVQPVTWPAPPAKSIRSVPARVMARGEAETPE
jgi:hypothetical protein